MCIMKLAEKYLTRQNSAMSGQNSVCLDTMTEQCVKVIFGSVHVHSIFALYCTCLCWILLQSFQ